MEKFKLNQNTTKMNMGEKKVNNEHPNQLRFVQLHLDYMIQSTCQSKCVASSHSTNNPINFFSSKNRRGNKIESDKFENQMATLKNNGTAQNRIKKKRSDFD